MIRATATAVATARGVSSRGGAAAAGELGVAGALMGRPLNPIPGRGATPPPALRGAIQINAPVPAGGYGRGEAREEGSPMRRVGMAVLAAAALGLGTAAAQAPAAGGW